MRIEITTCHSIIAQCLENLSQFDVSSTGNLLLGELYKRKLVIHDDLQNQYFDYFEKERPDLCDMFITLFQTLVSQQDNVKIIESYSNKNLTSNAYYNTLLGISNVTEDKILLSNCTAKDFCESVSSNSINKLSSKDVLNRSNNNLLNNYRLPIIRKVIRANQSSNDLSNWLSRFLNNQDNFIIIDNYIYENRTQFLKYFLSNVKPGAYIQIFTMINKGNNESKLKSTFQSAPFNKWNFKIHIVTRKVDQHARDIITDQYYIEIDKGMMVFGRNGLTHQANITITYKEDIQDDTLPPAKVVS
ncbi:hypothetical protein IHV12_05530 [Fictibacillus sp. 7GRE50]|uniref:hypothetical protein n=1 Tax=Fictibacillus sp. 7GRE50 TaxID=2745878 RepID=UPI0018CEE2EF|nr:hypothetical protein [Fictibacillus sp. 7GRE50]MBH0164367.1 hypothetical protein [Fictibacillus sp. 7GRE50]